MQIVTRRFLIRIFVKIISPHIPLLIFLSSSEVDYKVGGGHGLNNSNSKPYSYIKLILVQMSQHEQLRIFSISYLIITDRSNDVLEKMFNNFPFTVLYQSLTLYCGLGIVKDCN